MGVCLPLTALAALAIWVGALRRLMRAASPERRQLAWFICAAGPLSADTCVDAPLPVVAVCFCPVPVVVAVGVLRYRLLAITDLLSRRLVYGPLTALVIAVHLVAGSTIGAVTGPSSLPGVVAAAVVAAGLAPARERLRRTVDRWFLGSGDDPLRALTGRGDRSADADEHDLLRTLGTMTVADQISGEPQDRDDTRLLRAIAQQIAGVVRAHELTATVAAQRNHVVDATRTECDRIRQDLRNELGPSVDEVTAAVGEIRRMIDSLQSKGHG
ncbi:HAMP domain-containing protein [Streptomyces umbrinus]|uniref:hypothetical protein n=1 Tax=Streptomyces umbrinus TaxID=67370 RepID=UPI00167EAD2F|nr:hypothetical protein [Streptomyces umbrinus]MCR3724664.1 HAMP domain-containing protein [Streptomyces umbrinus]GHH50625.1 hypothetical protein GCM10018775_48060 [Streptomyces umbrinus]